MKLKSFGRGDTSVLDHMREKRVFIYGNGDYAHDLERFFKKLDVPIEAYLVDDGYYVSGMHQHKVRRLSDEVRDVNEGKAYLIWGIAKPSKLRDAMRENYISEAWITYDCNYLWQDSQYARKHLKEFQKARDLFEDTISQKTFDDYLKIYDGDIFGDLENIVDGTYYNDLTSVVSGGHLLIVAHIMGILFLHLSVIMDVIEKFLRLNQIGQIMI